MSIKTDVKASASQNELQIVLKQTGREGCWYTHAMAAEHPVPREDSFGHRMALVCEVERVQSSFITFSSFIGKQFKMYGFEA